MNYAKNGNPLSMSSGVSIYNYDDYRKYLRDYYLDSKRENPKFSHRYFARLAGIVSPSFLKHVIDGKKNLSEESIEKFAKALKLNKDEKKFFSNLVLLNQSTDTKQRLAYSKELLRSRAYKRLHPLKLSQLKFLSKWYYIAIRELVSLPGFVEDPEWISQKLKPSVPSAEVKRAIEELIKLGLLNRDITGKLIQIDKNVMANDELSRASMIDGHREMLKKAEESIELVPREKRDLSALTLKISPQLLEKIKEMIHNFRNDLMEETSHSEDPNSVYQLNLYLFPLAQIDEKKENLK